MTSEEHDFDKLLSFMRKSLKNRKVRVIVAGSFALFAVLLVVSVFFASSNASGKKNVTDRSSNSSNGVVGIQIQGARPHIDTTQLLSGINSNRISAGTAALTMNDELNQSAQAKCNDMVAKNYWAHNDPAGNKPWHFMTDAGYDYATAGENLAYGFYDSSSAVTGWMHSPEHKANILNSSYTETGFGVCSSDNYVNAGKQTIIVEHFASPRSIQGTQSAPTTRSSTPAYVAPVCTKTPIPYQTVYQDASYMDVGQTSSYGGYDGYTETCTPDSTGYKPADYTIPPIVKTVLQGTRPVQTTP